MSQTSPLDPDAEADQIAANRAYVRTHIPGAVPLIRELLDAGMSDGWRNVVYAGPATPEPPETTGGAQLRAEAIDRAWEETLRRMQLANLRQFAN
jgi:hypothetical protein